MKRIICIFSTLVLAATTSQAIEPIRPLPSKVTAVNCEGEGQKLKMEWLSSASRIRNGSSYNRIYIDFCFAQFFFRFDCHQQFLQAQHRDQRHGFQQTQQLAMTNF